MKRRIWLLVCMLLVAAVAFPALGEEEETDDFFFDVYVDPNPVDEEGLLPPDTPEPEITPEPVAEEILEYTAAPTVQQSGQFVITVGGDTTLGSIREHEERNDSFYSVVTGMGHSYPFSGLYELFAGDDLTLVNLEGPLTYSENAQEKKYRFRGPPDYVNILTEGSVEAVNLANNHSQDYGEEGYEDTKRYLDGAGIIYCGSKLTGIYEKDGIKVGLIGNTFPYSEKGRDISSDVKSLREAGCQIIIASFHWGSEYEYDFTAEQRKIGRAAINAGADVVVGHHPHVIQGIEKYKDRYIIYSLGNLVFGGNLDPDDRDAYLCQLTFDVSGAEIPPPSLQVIPIRLTDRASGTTDYRPVLPDDATRERILSAIARRSKEMDGEI